MESPMLQEEIDTEIAIEVNKDVVFSLVETDLLGVDRPTVQVYGA